MTAARAFAQVDVFSARPLKGNPVAVVLDGGGLSDRQMADLANWTNLSETTFLLPPSQAGADYRLRIFTPQAELPFAGHPTLGSCHAWLEAGGIPQGPEIVQECAAGLIRIRRNGSELAFAAPPLLRQGPVAPDLLARILPALGLQADQVAAAEWVDNGPGWLAILLHDRDRLLAVQPDYAALRDLEIGLVAPGDQQDADFELRAFMSEGSEDPVTGSLNASVAQWLIGKGLAPRNYTAAQDTVLGRAGRIRVTAEGETIWIGGQCRTCIRGQLTL